MKHATILLGSVLAFVAHAGNGPTATYNEAIHIVGGQRVVEVAPFPPHMRSAVSTFSRPSERRPLTNTVAMIETPDGLMDCAGTLWYHPKACSPSTFGQEKRPRTWIVMMGGKWYACSSPTSSKTCAPIIVDGMLRPIPTQEG